MLKLVTFKKYAVAGFRCNEPEPCCGVDAKFAAVARLPTAPVLQVHGADDPYLLASTARTSLRWTGPQLRSELLPRTGHFPHAERPDTTTGLLLDFLPR